MQPSGNYSQFNYLYFYQIYFCKMSERIFLIIFENEYTQDGQNVKNI